jgi:hypothetical protein
MLEGSTGIRQPQQLRAPTCGAFAREAQAIPELLLRIQTPRRKKRPPWLQAKAVPESSSLVENT